MELNGTPDTYIAGMMDAARIVRERKGKYTLEQTANYLEALCHQSKGVNEASTPLPKIHHRNSVRSLPQTSDKDIHHCPHCGGDTLESRSVLVDGVWLRFIEGKAQVLAEVEGKWRLLMEESLDGNPTFSHVYEPLGIRSAPVDPLMEMTYALSRSVNVGKSVNEEADQEVNGPTCGNCGRKIYKCRCRANCPVWLHSDTSEAYCVSRVDGQRAEVEQAIDQP